MQHRLFLLPGIVACFLTSILIFSHCSRPEDVTHSQRQTTPELANYMSQLQYFSHKLALSVEAENREAAEFYFHEVEELIEAIKEDVPEYEGYDIAGLMEGLLESAITPAENALKDNDWEKTRSGLITFINACNTCHQATNHGFIWITPGFGANPYNQTFESR